MTSLTRERLGKWLTESPDRTWMREELPRRYPDDIPAIRITLTFGGCEDSVAVGYGSDDTLAVTDALRQAFDAGAGVT